jgi:hypothetical protein
MAFVGFSSIGFTPEQQKRIIDTLTPKLRACAACGKNGTWQLMTEGVVQMPIAPNVGAMQSAFYSQPSGYGEGLYGLAPYNSPRTLPCIVLTCGNCGHLQFYSVLQLGLGAVLGVVAPLLGMEGQ